MAPVDVSAFSEFSKKLLKFLLDEGKYMTDIQALFSPQSSSSPESIKHAMGELLEKTMKPSGETNVYR